MGSLIHELTFPMLDSDSESLVPSEVSSPEKCRYKQNPIFFSADSIHLLDLHKTAVPFNQIRDAGTGHTETQLSP